MTGDSPWMTEEFIYIALQQNELEDQLARHCNRILFCDTDSFATCVWHERYMGCVSPGVEELARDRVYALYLLTDVDTPFVQDGVRDGEHLREWMHGRFIEELVRRDKPYLLLTGSHESRLAAAIDACDALLRSSVRSSTL
jgi:nicotinamide riboside kinase